MAIVWETAVHLAVAGDVFDGVLFGSVFLCPATKSGGVLCYTLRTFECLSVRLSVCPSVRPSAVDHSCPLYNFDTVQDNFTKLGTNVKHDQTTCRD